MVLDFPDNKGPTAPSQSKKTSEKASKPSQSKGLSASLERTLRNARSKGSSASLRSKKTVERDLQTFQEASKDSVEACSKSPSIGSRDPKNKKDSQPTPQPATTTPSSLQDPSEGDTEAIA